MSSFLDSVEQFLRQEIGPKAAEIDQSPTMLQAAFQALGDRNWLALRIPESWGGAAIDSNTFQQFQAQVARYSGALAFLQTQHQSAGSFLYQSENDELKHAYLPQMGRGEISVGVGFAHLRRAGEPSLKAQAMDGGYLLDGRVPWVTGFGIFQSLIVAAVLPDQQAVYGIVPFQTMEQANASPASSFGHIRFGAPMAMAAMAATNTVMAELHQWWLPESEVVLIQAADGIAKRDIANVLQPCFFALGCAEASLDVILDVMKSNRFSSAVETAHHALAEQLHQCRSEIFAADSRPYSEKVGLRAWAIELAVRCAHAAVMVSAGQANLLHHPAQRIYREALVFSVTGQTSAVTEATLIQLATLRRSRPGKP